MAIVVSPHEDSATGRVRAHHFCSLYLSLFPNIAKETGVDPAHLAEVQAAFARGGVEAAAAVLDPAVPERLTAAGTPAECQARLDEYRAAGVELPVLVALEDSVELAIDSLA